ncbi:MAG: glycerophosphodiester phosphodiesterase family protein [Williamsia sp.]|nr:glycerophosphodiester phosphodiesterase family protein [Williamsia sp.]
MKLTASLFFSLAALMVCVGGYAQGTAYDMPRKGLCAHRGGMDTHPENTLPAFKNAIAHGVQMIEFDIQFSKDSMLVIMHDETLDRTTTGSGPVADLTGAQIRQLDAGIKKGAGFKGARVPLLEETLEIMPRNIWLNCHLKGGAALGKAVAAMVKRTGRLHQCLLACSEEAAAGAREVVPGIIICNADNKYRQDNQQYVRATIREGARFIQLLAVGSSEERKPFIQQLRNNHVSINYYFASKAEEAPALWNSGIDFILVNNLPLFLPVMKNYGIKEVNNEF